MITIFDRPAMTPEQRAERNRSQERLLMRRAAALLGVPVPEEAQRKYLRGKPVKYYFRRGYVPTDKEMTFVRKLCRDHNIPVPEHLTTPKRQKVWP